MEEITPDTKIVFELSCHQLEYMTVSPHIGILVNIHEEHLDHYGTMEKYVEAKRHIFTNQRKEDILICNMQCLPEPGSCPSRLVTAEMCIRDREGTQLLLYEGLESVLGGKFDKNRYHMTEEGQCIYAVFLSEDTLPTDQMIRQMEQWGRAHGYEATGRIYANDMASFFEKEKTNYALEIYMPIKGAVHE